MLPKGRERRKVGRTVLRPAEPEPKKVGRGVIKGANRDRTARSAWSARSLLPLWGGPRRSKALASRTHSKRFAKHVADPVAGMPHLQIPHRKIYAKMTDFRMYVSSASPNSPEPEQNRRLGPCRGALGTARPTLERFGQHSRNAAEFQTILYAAFASLPRLLQCKPIFQTRSKTLDRINTSRHQ